MSSSIRDLEHEKLVEMSIVDITYHLLKESDKQPKHFMELLDEIMRLKEIPMHQREEVMTRLYTEINIDGRFKALGDNVWGLRAWYPVEQAEEIVITEVKKKKKRYNEDEEYLVEEELEDLDDLDELDDEEMDDIDDLDDFDDDEDELEDLDDDLEDLDENLEDDLDLEDSEEFEDD